MGDGAPVDYGQLFEQYFPYVRRLAIKEGISLENVDDVAQELIIRFMERGSLQKFNPSRGVRFRTFLTAHVKLSVRSFKDQQRHRQQHEPISCDVVVGGVSWAELHSPVEDDESDHIHTAMVFDDLQRSLDEREGSTTRRKAAVLRMMREEITANGSVERKAIAQRLGVGLTTVGTMIQSLRSECVQAGLA